MQNTARTLKKYVRSRRDRRPIGVVVSFVENNKIHYGWSLCNKLDRFDKEVGISLAIQRAVPVAQLSKNALNREVAQTVTKDLASMIDRSEAYFRRKS